MPGVAAAVATARRLLSEEFPETGAAWLGGSVAAGNVTAGSDLDITVLLPGPPAPFRDSRMYERRPVELFVHTKTSLEHYRSKDRDRRQPSIMRLVGESVVLVDVDGTAARLQAACAAEVLDGPEALSPDELASKRYAVTDLVTDLESSSSSPGSAVISSLLWQREVAAAGAANVRRATRFVVRHCTHGGSTRCDSRRYCPATAHVRRGPGQVRRTSLRRSPAWRRGPDPVGPDA